MNEISSKQYFSSILGSSNNTSPLIWAGITGVVVVICTRMMHHYSRNMQIPQFFKSRHFNWLTTGGILLAKELIGGGSLTSKVSRLVISISTAVFTDYFLSTKKISNPIHRQKENPLHEKKKKIEIIEIPEKWDEDKIFQQYTCSLNYTPTSNPVFDPIAKNDVYDQSTVYKWLRTNRSSPMTRKPLNFRKLPTKPIINSLIIYRLKQLQEYEKILNDELLPKTNSEHCQWIEESAQKLNDEIKSYIDLDEEDLKMKLETLTEFPPFLDGAILFWLYRCSHSGKTIVHHLLPKFDYETLEKDPKLAEICYDKFTIIELLKTSSSPKNWPNQLAFTQENLIEEPRINIVIQKQFLQAIQELKDHYKPFDPPKNFDKMEETIEITKDK